jgi:dynein heavy chain, axonemal
VQVKVSKVETDLLIDQLAETFHVLGKDKVSVNKYEKRLDEVKHRWDEIKKSQPQVKTDVEPIQLNEADRIKKDVERFATKVHKTPLSRAPSMCASGLQTEKQCAVIVV